MKMSTMNQNERSPIMRYCGNCGKELLAKATFCAYCGAPIPKIGAIPTPQGGIPYLVEEKSEITPRRPFLVNFRGAILTPKTAMPQITSSPNYTQPILINLLVGILFAIGLFIFFGKFEIIFSDTYLDALPLEIFPDESILSEYESFYTFFMPITSIIYPLLISLLLSLILWALHAIFASDLNRNDRNYKKMVTIVGWAQIPLIFNRIITGILYFLSQGGTIEYYSVFEREIRANIPIDQFSLVLMLITILWSLVFIYFSIKSLGSKKSNPLTICMIFGILNLFFFPTIP